MMSRVYVRTALAGIFLVVIVIYWYHELTVAWSPAWSKPVAVKVRHIVNRRPKPKGLAGRDFLPEHLQNVDQHNEELIKYIKNHWVFPPSFKPWNLKHMTTVHYSQVGQSAYVDELLGGKTRGNFIDCGAYDGEEFSNSLFFERQRDWSGVLIEGNPKSFQKLLSKNRNAHSVNACLSPKTTPVSLNYSTAALFSAMADYRIKGRPAPTTSIITVQCLPLLSIMKATGIEHVDYFSLDVEGAELDILRTIPFNEVNIGVMGVESLILTNDGSTIIQTKAKIAALGELLGKYNYTIIRPADWKFYDTMLQKK